MVELVHPLPREQRALRHPEHRRACVHVYGAHGGRRRVGPRGRGQRVRGDREGSAATQGKSPDGPTPGRRDPSVDLRRNARSPERLNEAAACQSRSNPPAAPDFLAREIIAAATNPGAARRMKRVPRLPNRGKTQAKYTATAAINTPFPTLATIAIRWDAPGRRIPRSAPRPHAAAAMSAIPPPTSAIGTIPSNGSKGSRFRTTVASSRIASATERKRRDRVGVAARFLGAVIPLPGGSVDSGFLGPPCAPPRQDRGDGCDHREDRRNARRGHRQRTAGRLEVGYTRRRRAEVRLNRRDATLD